MKKSFITLLCVVLVAVFMPTMAFADAPQDMSPEEFLETEKDGVITLNNDVNLTSSLTIDDGETVTIDLNGHTLSAANKTLTVTHGTLELKGMGVVKETEPYYAPVLVKGSNNPAAENYSVVKVEEGVTLEGWAGIFIDKNGSDACGVTVDFNGKINSVFDTAGAAGHGIYINGTICNTENYPVINVGASSKIDSRGIGIYGAGYAEWNVFGTITAETTGIELRAGELNIEGAAITAKAPFAENANGNGTTVSGAAVAISQHSTDLPISVNLKSGTFTGEKALYEVDLQNETATDQISILVNGGTFNGGVGSENVEAFITGGTFKEDVSDYLANGLKQDETGNVIADPETAEAKIGNINYVTLEDAVEAAMPEDTVQLLKDVDALLIIEQDKDFTLDLNGHTITSSTAANPQIGQGGIISNSGKLTIESSVEGGTVDAGTLSGTAAIYNSSTASCTIKSGIIKRGDDNTFGYYTVNNQGTMEITGTAAVNNNSNKSSMINNDGTLTVSGGTIRQDAMTAIKVNSGTLKVTGSAVIISKNNQAIQNWSKTDIEGGAITGIVATFAWNDTKAETNITGGKVIGNVNAINYQSSAKNPPVVNISGTAVIDGTLKTLTGTSSDSGTAVTDKNQAAINVSGGVFTKPVAPEHCADGYKPTDLGNGNFGVHDHTLIKLEAKKPTCTKDGNIECWYCDGCGKYYEDEAGTEEVSKEEAVIKADGHKYDKMGECTVCGAVTSDRAAADEVDKLIDAIGPVDEITLDSFEAIDAAAVAYNNLTDAQKKLVSGYDDLLAAYEAYEALLAEAGTGEKPAKPQGTAEDTDSPKTGDTTSALPFILLAITAAAAAGTMTMARRREE